jgi:hypothetical protein
MRQRWQNICISEQGSRKANADASLCIRQKRGRRSLWALVLCDGIGTNSRSAAIADKVRHFVGKQAMTLMERILRKRLSPNAEKTAGEALLPRLPKGVQPPSVGSTLAVAISDGQRTWAFWAGDTRIYVLNLDGELVLLTEDDHNDDGQLTSYACEYADGLAAVRLRSRCWRGRIQAMAATTDGVHGSCSHSELQAFIRWQLRNGALVSRRAGAFLKAFLGDNLDDNASLAMWWEHGATRRLRRITGKNTGG